LLISRWLTLQCNGRCQRGWLLAGLAGFGGHARGAGNTALTAANPA
jgi:hypothetical protein